MVGTKVASKKVFIFVENSSRDSSSRYSTESALAAPGIILIMGNANKMKSEYRFCRLLWPTALIFSCFLSFEARAASCYAESQAIAPEVLNSEKEAIRSNSANWLKSQRGNLAGRVRDIAASDPDFAPTIAAAAAKAPSEQAAAIGSGLGQAANACRVDHPDEASKIQQAAAGSENENFLVSFNSTAGNTQTTSVGAAGGGAPGGGAANGGAGVGGGTTSTTTVGSSSSGGGGTTVSTAANGGTPNRFQAQTSVSFGSLSSLTPATSTLTTTTTTTIVGASSVSTF